jgi:mRNA-degrading endonuclease HigB of HigAB toxin-antitoxin module
MLITIKKIASSIMFAAALTMVMGVLSTLASAKEHAGNILVSGNNEEDLTVPGDGDFSFKTLLAPKQEYAVMVKRLPLNQRCDMKNDKGNSSSLKNSKVEITCRQTGKWHHPLSIKDAISIPGKNVRDPAVAINTKGNALVAWSQYDGASWRIYKREYRNNSWSQRPSVDEAISPAGYNARYPRVALDEKGDAIIVWMQKTPTSRAISMAEKRSGQWKIPLSVNDSLSFENKFSMDPDVAMDEEGNAIVVWSQEASNGFHSIFKAEYRNGRWIKPASLEDSISRAIKSGDGIEPRVVMNNSNEALIVWGQDPGGGYRLYKSESREGSWVHPSHENNYFNPVDLSNSKRGAHDHAPVLNDAGEAAIAWKQFHNKKDRIYLSQYHDGLWQHPKSLSEAISPESFITSTMRDIAMDNQGNGILLWTQTSERKQELYKNEFSAGRRKKGDDKELVAGYKKTDFSYYIYNAEAEIADSGKKIIAWLEAPSGSMPQVHMQEFDNGAWYSRALNIGSNPASRFTMASSPRGHFIIAWQQGDGNNDQIYSSVFTRLE